MKLEDIKQTAVIGAGVMGSQIAELLSRLGGYEVQLVDVSEELVRKGLQSIEERLERFFVSKGKLTAEERKEILARIKGNTNLEEAAGGAQFVVEAVPERMALKKEVFSRLDQSAPPGHPGLKHLHPEHHGDSLSYPAAGEGRRDALLQPGGRHEAG